MWDVACTTPRPRIPTSFAYLLNRRIETKFLRLAPYLKNFNTIRRVHACVHHPPFQTPPLPLPTHHSLSIGKPYPSDHLSPPPATPLPDAVPYQHTTSPPSPFHNPASPITQQALHYLLSSPPPPPPRPGLSHSLYSIIYDMKLLFYSIDGLVFEVYV